MHSWFIDLDKNRQISWWFDIIKIVSNKFMTLKKWEVACRAECRGVAGAHSDRLTSHFILPLLRLWIMEIMAECLLSSSSFCFSLASSWTFCSSRDDAWWERSKAKLQTNRPTDRRTSYCPPGESHILLVKLNKWTVIMKNMSCISENILYERHNIYVLYACIQTAHTFAPYLAWFMIFLLVHVQHTAH